MPTSLGEHDACGIGAAGHQDGGTTKLLLPHAQVIAELDEKKREALERTWRKVNADFGSIFAMLLPGTSARLDPPEGGTFLDGARP